MKIFTLSLLIYLLVLIFPVIFYLKYKDKVNPITYLKLDSNVKRGILTGLTISVLFISFLLIKKAFTGWTSINLNIGILWISGIMVGFLEEIPFRGFVLQKFMGKMDFIKADILASLCFVAVHLPIWLFNGVNLVSSAASVFFISLILGYLFEEYDSLYVTIICHSVFNLCVWTGLT